MTGKAEAIKAATSIARDVAEGRLDPDSLEKAALDECRALFGRVAGPGDALWPLHVDVVRQGVALGALSAGELAEWTAVFRRREQDSDSRPVVAAQSDERRDFYTGPVVTSPELERVEAELMGAVAEPEPDV